MSYNLTRRVEDDIVALARRCGLKQAKAVLETYHKALHPQKTAPEKDAASKDTPKKTKKRSSEMEL